MNNIQKSKMNVNPYYYLYILLMLDSTFKNREKSNKYYVRF